jgi:hypothetical protein
MAEDAVIRSRARQPDSATEPQWRPIAVRDIVELFRRYDGDTKRIHDEVYPHLEPEAIEVALAYYAAHPEEIDRYVREDAEDEAARGDGRC